MSEVKPALTPDEWAEAKAGIVHVDDPSTPSAWKRDQYVVAMLECAPDGGVATHGAAAVLLHGQPFGFTSEDVAECRERAAQYEAMHDEDGDLWFYEAKLRWENRADRIEALLPPESD